MPKEQLGATGKFPQGKLNENDEGELKAGMAVIKDKVVIQFGKPISWLAMTAEEALTFASGLHLKAEEIIEKRKSAENGSTQTGDQDGG